MAASRRLFRIYMEHPGRLPPSYQGQTAKQPFHRVVCDYIAGMTDPYLQKTIESLSR